MLAPLCALAGCAEREDPVEAGKRAQENLARAAAQAEAEAQAALIDAQTTKAAEASGAEWVSREQDGSRVALYGPPDGGALVTVRCDATMRAIVIERATLIEGNIVDVRLGSGAQTQIVSATARQGPLPTVEIVLPFDNPYVTTLAADTTPLRIQIGEEQFVAPASETVSGLVEECRA